MTEETTLGLAQPAVRATAMTLLSLPDTFLPAWPGDIRRTMMRGDMRIFHFLSAPLASAFLLTLAACSDAPDLPPPAPLPPAVPHAVSFAQDVQPILTRKCLVCHGCFDAPCQLKLESAEGLARGAHHDPVYAGTRTTAAPPTRLGIDALSVAQWREKGFHSVLEAGADGQSLLYGMLALGKQRPFPPNSRLPGSIALGLQRQDQCVDPADFGQYARKHPLEGMPLGTTGLSDEEFARISAWLAQGAALDETATEPLSGAEQDTLQSWERFFNRDGPRERLTSRWLFEHLFLAHIHFPEHRGGPPRFYELLRSHTPPGEPVVPVATVRPNDDPGGPFYYRLRPLDQTIVHKRHITFAFDASLMRRIETLFFAGSDEEVERVPDYGYTARSNPFLTFSALPARARYQFMLDHAEYFVRTFIRGPVCRGQIATDVIRDHFWTLFQAPDADLFVTDAEYSRQVAPLLGLPGQDDDLVNVVANWNSYRDRRNTYLQSRASEYQRRQPDGASMAHVWDGDGHNRDALLTIFRHHDSAAVSRGLIGEVPQTLWLLDYPLLERTYYELVVNFDVFGNIAHQAQTRLYFDLIRNGAEHNFLRLMPAGQRRGLMDDWYRGSGRFKLDFSYTAIDDSTPSAEKYLSNAPKAEFATRLLTRLRHVNAVPDDFINRCQMDDCGRPDQPDWIQRTDQSLSTLASRPAKHVPGIGQFPEMAFLRVVHGDERTIYSLVRNRAHSNVAFMAGESLRYEPERDTLTIHPGILGSFPNFMFEVDAKEVSLFALALAQAETPEAFTRVVERWGIRRTHPRFWDILHDVTAWHREHAPLEAGVFDINRYENR